MLFKSPTGYSIMTDEGLTEGMHSLWTNHRTKSNLIYLMMPYSEARRD